MEFTGCAPRLLFVMALLLAYWTLRECFHDSVQNLEFISCLLHLFTILNETYFSFFPKLIIAMEELKQCRLQQRNISATVDKLTLCLPGEELEIALCFNQRLFALCLCLTARVFVLLFPVLEMYSKLREQMKSKR